MTHDAPIQQLPNKNSSSHDAPKLSETHVFASQKAEKRARRKARTNVRLKAEDKAKKIQDYIGEIQTAITNSRLQLAKAKDELEETPLPLVQLFPI